MLKLFAAICFTSLLFACATANKINAVSLGMTKSQVIAVMGNPASTSAIDGTEYLIYKLFDTEEDAFNSDYTDYFVRIVNGSVDAYGRQGDFGTSTPQTIRIENR